MNHSINLSELETELMRYFGLWQDRKNWSHDTGLNTTSDCFVVYSYSFNDRGIYINVGPLSQIKVPTPQFCASRNISGSELGSKATIYSVDFTLSEDSTLLQAVQIIAQKHNLQLADRFADNDSYFFQKTTTTTKDTVRALGGIKRALQDYQNFKKNLPTILRHYLLD